LHVADSKLAHVVIVPSLSFADNQLESCTWTSLSHISLDNGCTELLQFADAPLRAKRIQLFIDYPNKEQVRAYVRAVLEEIRQKIPKYTPADVKQITDWIVNCVGGNMEDLDQVLTALKRGEQYGSVLRRMITDSITVVEGI
jgi:hypothetical protein